MDQDTTSMLMYHTLERMKREAKAVVKAHASRMETSEARSDEPEPEPARPPILRKTQNKEK